jgi:hypothetical protein
MENPVMSDPLFTLIDIPELVFNRIRELMIQANPTLVNASWSLGPVTYDRVDFQINYANLAVQSSMPVALDSSEFSNCTSVQDQELWQRSTTTKTTSSWTNTTGYKLGASTNFSIIDPLKGETFEYSSQDSMTQTNEEDQTWQLSNTVPVPPGTKVTATWMLYENQYETDYTVVIRPVGMKIMIQVNIPWLQDVGFDFTFNVDDFMTPAELTFQGSGTFKGIHGNTTVTNTNESTAVCPRPVTAPFGPLVDLLRLHKKDAVTAS